MRGLFLSLDGIDGCGKSTQCGMLYDWLLEHEHRAIPCADPGSTNVGWKIRELLLSRHELTMVTRCEALLFMASRAQLVEQVIEPALADGQTVVSDRFLLANVVYQGHAGGLKPEELWEVGRWSAMSILPDLSFVLDIDPETAAKRREGEKRDYIESRERDYHRKVREGFLREAERDPERIRVIDADRTPEEVHEAICQEVSRVLEAGPRA